MALVWKLGDGSTGGVGGLVWKVEDGGSARAGDLVRKVEDGGSGRSEAAASLLDRAPSIVSVK